MEHPLVSCVMPTADRRAFVPRAVRWFRRQTYPNLELLVYDTGDDSVEDLMPPDDPRVHYVRPAKRGVALGRLRNLANEAARGEIIAHWDDDDWYAPDRVAASVAALNGPGAEICGFAQLYYYHAARRSAYLYRGDARDWLGAIAYRRVLWRRHPFPPIQIGSDANFVRRSRIGGRRSVDRRLMVATIHAANVSWKQTSRSPWKPIAVEEIREIVGEDWKEFGHDGG